MNKNDWNKVESDAKKAGFSWNSDGDRLKKGDKEIRKSESGLSGYLGGAHFNTSHDAKKKM